MSRTICIGISPCDSCLIFLPMLHGKELISVDLGTHDALHPVQKAMVDCDGSQCSGDDLDLQARDQRYLRPSSLASALALRAAHPEALIVCGGTDLGLKATKQKQLLPLLLDLSGVPKLSHIVPS